MAKINDLRALNPPGFRILNGVPTRYLDWARNPLVALYFACSKYADVAGELYRYCENCSSESDGCGCAAFRLKAERKIQNQTSAIYAISRRNMENAGMLQRAPTSAAGVSRFVARFIYSQTATNPNLHAQSGELTLVIADHDHGLIPSIADVACEYQESSKLDIIREITFPTRLAPTLLRLLAGQGVTAGSVYPGYGGSVRHIFEALRHKAPKLPPVIELGAASLPQCEGSYR